ncbi:MAG: aminoacyl-tRNA hydrolase [Deferribacteraceae bacterium]|jgi:PTH1 family peptidyl-tRNA hydrolase|nr:aminoacyl-tRNA hydrolase [Deferribacteraceae bacterium]
MLYIIGLGNPGKQYEHTRHNIGFMVLDKLAERNGLTFREDFKGLYATGMIAGEKCHFLKPQTYMNLSGEAVGELCRYFKATADEVCVVYDELDFSYGVLKLRKNGSAGGHNGIKSLIQHLGTEDFARFRMGIAGMHRSKISGHTADYVLAQFTGIERETLDEFTTRGAEAIEMAAKEGFTKAMNEYNKLAKEMEAKIKAAKDAATQP